MRTSINRKIYDTLDLIINLEFLKVPSTKVLLSRIIIALPFLLISKSIFGQLSYNAKWFTDSEGLPQNSIKDIFPDKYNFIWLSTENGLVRYDGQDFKLFNDTNIKGLKSNRMKFFEGSMETDSLFSVNNSGDIILINKRRATTIKDQSRNLQPFFGRYRYYWNTPPQSLVLKKNNLARYVLSDKSFYLVGNDSIKRYKKEGVLKWGRPYSFKDTIQFFVHNNKLYNLSRYGTVSLLKNKTFVPVKLNLELKPDTRIYSNNITDKVFLYTNKQLFLLSFHDKLITSKLILENFEFEQKNIYSVHYDEKNEILYLGSLTQGLCIVKKKYFQNISTNKEAKDNIEYGLNKLNDSTLLTATGIRVENRQPVEQYKLVTENSLRYIAQLDSSNNFWVSNGHSLYKFYSKNNYSHYDQVSFKEKTRSALIQETNLWIGTGPEKNRNGNGELFLLDLESPKISPISVLKTPHMITSLAALNDSILFVGTHQGLYKYHRNQNRLSLIKNLENSYIRSMYVSHNNLWITTYEDGFFLYQDSKVWTFPLDKNRYLATAHCIIEDDNGYFWITTNKGLFQVCKNDLFEYLNNKDKAVYYHYYDKSSGFSNNEFNGGGCPCGVQMTNKDIFLPSLDGLVVFNSSTVRPILPNSGVYIDEVIVDGVQQFTTGTLTLKDPERITFQITSPFYGNPYNNQIEIQMDDGIWEPIGTSRTQSYTNLPSGEHFIRARKPAGFNLGYHYASLNIYVIPTFWQSNLFKALLILLLGFLTYMTILLRTRYITKKNIQLKKKINENTLQLQQTVHILREAKVKLKNQVSQQKKLVTAITHDVKSPLRFMALTSKFSFENFENRTSEELRESTKAMFTSSYQLYQFIENVLDYSSISLDNEKLNKTNFILSNLIQTKIIFFENISNSRKLEVMNRIPESVQLSLNQQLFSIIIHNLLDNSIKNTFGGKIIFWHEKDGDRFILNIEDTGLGMSTETLNLLDVQKESIANGTNGCHHKRKGFGLTIVMELLTMLDGDIQFESKLRKGTKVSISFKTDH